MAKPVDLVATRRAFGRRLRDARLAADLTQADLATDAGVTRSRTTKLERGNVVPRPAEVEALADALANATRKVVIAAAPPAVRAVGGGHVGRRR